MPPTQFQNSTKIFISPEFSSHLNQAYFHDHNISIDISNDFWIHCKENFSQEEVIEFSYFTPTSLTGRAYVGLIPAKIPHGNQTLNAEKKYACREIFGAF